ncbi:MAG: hypothetical protein IT208_01035 [Chthonomonadales bacterium]|nr:hypothetical protein [Chthonomonadales bacterium]
MAGTTGTSAEPYLYAGAWGYRSDGDAGLMLVGARYHDAQAGRFVTRDTLLSEHPYLYCEHEPVGGVDPSGHDLLPPNTGGDYGAGWMEPRLLAALWRRADPARARPGAPAACASARPVA